MLCGWRCSWVWITVMGCASAARQCSNIFNFTVSTRIYSQQRKSGIVCMLFYLCYDGACIWLFLVVLLSLVLRWLYLIVHSHCSPCCLFSFLLHSFHFDMFLRCTVVCVAFAFVCSQRSLHPSHTPTLLSIGFFYTPFCSSFDYVLTAVFGGFESFSVCANCVECMSKRMNGAECVLSSWWLEGEWRGTVLEERRISCTRNGNSPHFIFISSFSIVRLCF